MASDHPLLNETREQEIILEAITISVRDAIIMINNDGNITFWNKASCSLFGYSMEEVIGKNLHDLIASKPLIEEHRKAFQLFRTTGKGAAIDKTIELTAVRKDLFEFPIELSLSAVFIREQWHSIGIVHDVSNRKQSQDEIARERKLLRTLIDNLPDTFYVKDLTGRKKLANIADYQLLGYTSEAEALGKTDLEQFDGEIGARGYADDMDVLQNRKSVINNEENFIDPQGNECWLYTTKMPIRDDCGDIVGLIGIGRNITERRKAEQQLAMQTEVLKELNATKDKFFSIIAHDLKNPFNAILGYSKLMIQEFRETDQEEMELMLKRLADQSQLAYSLLENLLIWSQSQTGRIGVKPENIDLNALITKNISLLEVQADLKNLSINSILYDPCGAFADFQMVDTILRNLLSNATKFTPRGGIITVSSVCTGTVIEIAVKDTGVGIPPSLVENIFRIENKTTTKGTDKETGSGLGLIICKEFVEKNGGKIWVDSTENVGSTFTFTLPSKQSFY